MDGYGVINPPQLPEPRGWNHGLIAPAGGRILFVAGQTAGGADGRVEVDDFAALDTALRARRVIVSSCFAFVGAFLVCQPPDEASLGGSRRGRRRRFLSRCLRGTAAAERHQYQRSINRMRIIPNTSVPFLKV